MGEVIERLRKDLFSACLVLFSFIPLFIIGALLDVFLAHLYGRFGESANAALPLISYWALGTMAGYRFLAQEIMVCLWGLMVLSFLITILVYEDQTQRRIRFVQTFIFMWILGLTVSSFIALSCILPFDLMIDRPEGRGLVGGVVRIVLILEIAMILFVPVGLGIRRKSKGAGK